jgi:hypothetical protein
MILVQHNLLVMFEISQACFDTLYEVISILGNDFDTQRLGLVGFYNL